MSILDDELTNDPYVIHTPQSRGYHDEDDDMWRLLNLSPVTKCALVLCGLPSCDICKARYGLSDKCPVCGCRAIPEEYVSVVKCQCGANLGVCTSDGESYVICAASIPMVADGEDVI